MITKRLGTDTLRHVDMHALDKAGSYCAYSLQSMGHIARSGHSHYRLQANAAPIPGRLPHVACYSHPLSTKTELLAMCVLASTWSARTLRSRRMYVPIPLTHPICQLF